MARLRSGGSFLRIETGRHVALPRAERICPCCDKEVEHTSHFLLHCEAYAVQRVFHYRIITVYISTQNNPNLKFLWEHNKIEILYGSQEDLHLNELVMAYATSCYRKRCKLLNLEKKSRYWNLSK